jgi:hypothetical protein
MRISLIALWICVVACASPEARRGGPAGDGGTPTDGSADGGPPGSGASCVPCSSNEPSCDAGCRAFGTWVDFAARSVDFFVTIAAECNDGGYDIAGTEALITDGSDAPGGAPDAVVGNEHAVSPVMCPMPKAGECTSTAVCTWNQSGTPPPVIPMFRADGIDATLRPDIPHIGAETGATFTVASAGIPVSVGFTASRISPFSRSTVPADLLVDIVPTSQGIPVIGDYIVRARLDTSLLQYDISGNAARAVTLRFESNITTILQAGVVYALYWHIESPGVDSIGIGGMDMASSNSVAFGREIVK